MPLILISGYPSSGKTYRSNQLVEYFQGKIKASPEPHISRLNVVLINDQSLSLNRDVYREARPEKDARAAEYSAVKRALGRDTIVIADGLNYIKGFRRFNAELLSDPKQDGGYQDDIFENLVYRYEEPNGMTRWDSPLFTVPYEDATPPFEDIWVALVGTAGALKKVQPNLATVMKPASESDYLYELDKTTQEVLNRIIEWQKDHVGENGGQISVGGHEIELPASPVGLPQLQRIRRQFISLNRQHNLPKSRIRGSFVEHLNSNFG
ncbi:MAG: hypothetical protein Q9218_005596 [Villophora microphyllina]